MLQRPTVRSLRTLLRTPTVIPCTVCKFRCGAIVNSSASAPKRQYQTKRKAPTSRRIKTTPKNVHEAGEWMHKFLVYLYQLGEFHTTPDDALRFLDRFRGMAGQGTVTANPQATLNLIKEFRISEKDLMRLPALQLRDDNPDVRYMGKKLMLSLSRCGVVDASIRIMAEAVLQAKKNPRILKAPETQFAREHLAQVANKKLNYRAMVLEGKVAHLLGDEERAIQMWTDAMTEAVKAAEWRALREQQAGAKPSKEVARDPLELSSPWIELMLIHWERTKTKGKNEMAQCEWAMKIGCDQDDPTSHYYASTFLKQYDSHGNHLGTSDWLYHITKAASSGHTKAAYELGVFYAESGWKYIEDEPPDHIKPTPFDSYPAPTEAQSLWDRLRTFFGFAAGPEVKPHEALFHSAMFPPTAIQRQTLAYLWLGVAARYLYAPAFLFRARMLLADTIWAGADAPKSALNLTEERYTFASKEDYHSGIPIEKAEIPAGEDPPNPFRNIEAAKGWLKQVFYAHRAASCAGYARTHYRKWCRAGLMSEVVADEELLEGKWTEYLGINIQKWFRFPEVRAMYEDEIDDLYQEAKRICDTQGWDMYDDENALIYKAGSSKKRNVI